MRRWDIYWAECPFEDDSSKSKLRPVLVLKPGEVYVLSLKMTSHQVRENDDFDYALQHWREVNLYCETVVRVGKLSQIPLDAFHEYIGRIHADHAIQIIAMMKRRLTN